MIDIIKLIQEEVEDPKTVNITIKIHSVKIPFKVLRDNWMKHNPDSVKRGDVVVYPAAVDNLIWYRLNDLKKMIIPMDIGEYSVVLARARFEGKDKIELLKEIINSKLIEFFVQDVTDLAKGEIGSGHGNIREIARSYKKKDILILPDHEKFKFNFDITYIKEIK